MSDHAKLVSALRDDVVNIIEAAQSDDWDYNEIEDLVIEEIFRLQTFATQYINRCRSIT